MTLDERIAAYRGCVFNGRLFGSSNKPAICHVAKTEPAQLSGILDATNTNFNLFDYSICLCDLKSTVTYR